nr:carboxypeptidase-like regulatory domain-containing protein [Kofleriaceae bacterium]
MNKKVVAAVLALVAVGGALWWFKFRTTTTNSAVVATSGSGSDTGSGTTKPPTEDRWAKTTEQVDVAPTSARWSFDIDPEGNLPLEGQVLGPDGKGVANADVWLSSVPPRSTKTKEDGTFAFDKLVGRTYELS